jgi:hypothetical protein
MKHYTKPVLAFVVTVVVCYLATAFAMWECNPGNWTQNVRFLFVWCSSTLGLLSYVGASIR